MIMLDRWEETKREVVEVQRIVDQSDARFAEAMRQLKRKYGIKTLKQAIAERKKAQEDEREAARKWSEAEKAWRPVFEKVKKEAMK